jgi:prephenate dehydratase
MSSQNAQPPDKAVAFQGELGAFSHAAAEKLLATNVQAQPCASFRDVFEALRLNEVSYAVLPIENSLHGSIHENYDYLLEYGFHVVGETNLRISHQLIAMPGMRFEDVLQVYSHPVALNQCRNFFKQHPSIKATPYYDTAGSVKMLREEQPAGAAAIASANAADIYGGVILKRELEDDPQNFTRFFLLSKQIVISEFGPGETKTSLAFSTPNKAGALFKALACFALRDVSLAKIESRPLKGKPWEYLFYVDLYGALNDAPVKKALEHLSELAEFLKVLGSYRAIP